MSDISQQGDPGQQSGTGDLYEGLSDYGRRFVENAPEEERPYAAKYVREWDQGYQKKQQEWEQQLQPFRDLGDPEQVRQAVAVANMLQQNPRTVVERLYEAGLLSQDDFSFLQAQQQQDQGGNEDIPPHLMKRFEQMLESKLAPLQQGYGTLAQMQQQKLEEEQQRQQEAALQKDLENLKSKHGDFDETYVLALMAQTGMNGEDAVKQYQQMLDSAIKQRQAPRAPSIMSGSGNPPNFQKDLTKADDATVRNMLADALRQQSGR